MKAEKIPEIKSQSLFEFLKVVQQIAKAFQLQFISNQFLTF